MKPAVIAPTAAPIAPSASLRGWREVRANAGVADLDRG